MDMPGAADYTTDLTKYRFIGARAGYAVGQNLFYLKGGLVYTDMTTTFCSAATNDCQGLNPTLGGEHLEWGGKPEQQKARAMPSGPDLNVPYLGLVAISGALRLNT